MRYHHTPIRMAIIFSLFYCCAITVVSISLLLLSQPSLTNQQTSTGEVVEKTTGFLVHCWQECGLGQPLQKTVQNFLRKLKMELPFDPVIPLLGLYPKNPETPIQKNLCTPMFTAASFTITKCWKQPKCPSVNEWNKKLLYIYTMEYYAGERKKELLPFARERKKELLPFETAWIEIESVFLNE